MNSPFSSNPVFLDVMLSRRLSVSWSFDGKHRIRPCGLKAQKVWYTRRPKPSTTPLREPLNLHSPFSFDVLNSFHVYVIKQTTISTYFTGLGIFALQRILFKSNVITCPHATWNVPVDALSYGRIHTSRSRHAKVFKRIKTCPPSRVRYK